MRGPADVPYGCCRCGCGRKTQLVQKNEAPRGYVKGEPMRYLLGHAGASRVGVIPQTWYQSRGRWYVTGRDDKDYLWYRVLVENELGRPLDREEHVHHINGDPSDDRLENLQVLSRGEHKRLHMAQRPKRLCSVEGCGQKHYGRGLCKLHWRRKRDGYPKAAAR